MHPIATAWIRRRRCIELNIRRESWYYFQWICMCNDCYDWLYELENLPEGVR